MGVSDVISNVTKQNMNVMASTSTSPCKCKICIPSIEIDVYNKKKIQMFVVNMTFISTCEVKKMYIKTSRMLDMSMFKKPFPLLFPYRGRAALHYYGLLRLSFLVYLFYVTYFI